MQIRPLALTEPDPWFAALAEGAPWLRARLPFGDDDMEARAAAVDFPPVKRAALADALKAQAQTIGAGEASLAAIERLRLPDALVATTGQQTGALVGPMYTLLKAAGTVVYARRAEERLGRPVVPVFWAATEDHDVGEIQRVRLPLQGGGQHDFHLFQPVPPGRRPVGPIDAREELIRLLAEIRESNAMPGEHREAVLDLCASLVDDHPTVGGHFLALMARLFQGTPLVFLDPMDPALRRIVAPMLAKAVGESARVAAAAKAGIAALEADGREVQMPWQDAETGIFAILEGERHMLEVRGDDLVPRGRPQDARPVAAWVDEAGAHPERFSTAAPLRPILQGALLPVLGVVLGPGELRYHAQLREQFDLFEVPVPIVWPRPRAVLVGGTARRLLDRLGLTVDQVLEGWQAQLDRALAARDTIGIAGAFERFESQLRQAHGEWVTALSPLGKDIADLGEKNLRRLVDEANWLLGKAEQAHRQGNETLIRQYHTLGEHLAPEHGPQDRHFTAIAFLAQFGLDLGERFANAPDLCQTGLFAAQMGEAQPAR